MKDDFPWLDVTSNEAVDLIHERMTRDAKIIPTGLASIDKAVYGYGDRRGIPRGTYFIVGGASNIGKTQFGLHMLRQAAEQDERAFFLCYDMKRENAMMRIHQAIAAGVIPDRDWLPSRWQPEFPHTLKAALRKWRLSFMSGGIAIWTDGGRTIDDVREAVRMGADAGVTFFVIDHLQKVLVKGFGADAIAARAEIVSEAMDELCETHDVTICALSQLNRWATKDSTRSPTMQDLWGGTAMESNSELVFVLDHSRYERDPNDNRLARTWIKFDKNQMGPKGFFVPVLWNHADLTIREGMDDEISDWPQHKKRAARKTA